MKWYNVEFSRIGVLLFVGCLGLSMGAYVAGDFWAEEGCYTMFKIPIPTHEILAKHRRF